MRYEGTVPVMPDTDSVGLSTRYLTSQSGLSASQEAASCIFDLLVYLLQNDISPTAEHHQKY